ncbi:anti-repressor SinI family protein [Neobacillus niacini]|nr:anti-repressor SinI family protein [Neobacillus niacini]MCM3766722.1 anti-repressor SinI family protein [Neobacillus niacini]
MLDQEWIKLIIEAKQLGLTIEEIKEFLTQNSNRDSQVLTK